MLCLCLVDQNMSGKYYKNLAQLKLSVSKINHKKVKLKRTSGFQFLEKAELCELKEKNTYKKSAAWRKEYNQAWIPYGGSDDAVRRESS